MNAPGYCSSKIQSQDDVHRLAAALSGWKQEYAQVDKGILQGSLISMQLEGIDLFREQVNISVAQQATTPERKISFFVPLNLQENGRISHLSRCVSYDVPTLLPYESDVYWVNPHLADYAIASFDIDILQPMLTPTDFEALMSLQRTYAVHMPSTQFGALKHYLQHLLSPNTRMDVDKMHASNVLVDILLDMATSDNEQCWKPQGNQHLYIVRQCINLATNIEGHALGVIELCEAMKIPRRTLNYSFERVTGLSPSKYLRYIRLNQIRQTLLQSTESIGDIAAKHGFSHQAYFTKEYRLLFGETPSITRLNSKR